MEPRIANPKANCKPSKQFSTSKKPKRLGLSDVPSWLKVNHQKLPGWGASGAFINRIHALYTNVSPPRRGEDKRLYAVRLAKYYGILDKGYESNPAKKMRSWELKARKEWRESAKRQEELQARQEKRVETQLEKMRNKYSKPCRIRVRANTQASAESD